MTHIGMWLAVAVFVGLAGPVCAQRGPWPEYRNNGRRTASQNVTDPIDFQNPKWEIDIHGGSSPSGITLGPNNTLFVKGTGPTASEGDRAVVYCVNRETGAVIWEKKFDDVIGDYGGVSVGTEAIYACIYDGAGAATTKTVALGIDDGRLLWENFSAVGPRGTPSLGWIPNNAGHLNLYVFDRNGNQLLAIDSVTGATQWAVPTATPVGNVPFGQCGPLWEVGGKQVIGVFGDKGPNNKSGIAVQDDGNGTYTTLWEAGPASLNWNGNGVLSADGAKILISTFGDDGAQTVWVLAADDGHVVASGRDIGSISITASLALSPDGTRFYVAGVDYGDGGGAIAAYELDVNGCFERKWLISGMGPEIIGLTCIEGFVYGAGNDFNLWVIQDRGEFGTIVRQTPVPLSRNSYWGGSHQVVVDENGVGYTAENSRFGGDGGQPAAYTRKIWAFNPKPLTSAESGGPRITSSTRSSITLTWKKAGPPLYRVWRAGDPAGPFGPLSDVLTLETYTDTTPPADQAFYKVEWIPVNPKVQVAFYDFESGDQGWTHGGPVDDWQRGMPVDHTANHTAPHGACSGANAWATQLAANYSSNSDCFLKSPTFTLSVGKTGQLRFRMWMTSGVNSDRLHAKVYRAADDAPLLDLLSYFSTTTSGVDCWPLFSYSLGGIGGVPVYVKFEFRADYSLEYAGVYIDDVEILELQYSVPNVGDDGLIAFAPNGNIKWVWAAPGANSWWNRGGYSLSPDERTLYALLAGGPVAGGVFAIDTGDGSTKWHLNTAEPGTPGSPDKSGGGNGDFLSTPVVGADGTIYCIDINGTMAAIQDNGRSGSILWAVHQPSQQSAWNDAEGGIGPAGEVLFVSDGSGLSSDNMFLFQSAGSASPAAGVWPRYQRDGGNKGYATTGDRATSNFLSTAIPGGLWCGLALTPNGHWIVPSNDTAGEELKALDATLHTVWTFNMGDWSDGGAAVAADGTIFVGDNAGNIFSVTESKTGGVWSAVQNWSKAMGAPVNSRINIGPDGTVYAIVGVENTTLYALNPGDGSTRWSTPVGSGASWGMTTGLSADGSTIYFRTNGDEGLLYAISTTDGSVKWTRHVGGSCEGLHPVIATDGTIYQGATDIGSSITP